jgi:hypothetical protein
MVLLEQKLKITKNQATISMEERKEMKKKLKK